MRIASVRLAEPLPPEIPAGALHGGGSFAPGPETQANSSSEEKAGVESGAKGVSAPHESSIRVLLAEDHLMVRAGICALLESLEGIEVVAQASSGHEALLLLDEQARLGAVPQVAILDISMGGMNGMQTAAHIARHYPEIRIIMLSMHDSEEYVLQSLGAGAAGYLLKDSGVDELETAVRTVVIGKPYLSPAVSRHVVTDYLRRLQADGPTQPAQADPAAAVVAAPPYRDKAHSKSNDSSQGNNQNDNHKRDRRGSELVELTRRQREILPLLAQGYSTGQIAKHLSISIKTVETHRAQLMGRLNISDITGLVRYAIRHGYIDSP